MLRVLLPPNLAAAAARNAVAVKIELPAGWVPTPELVPVLAWLERQTGSAAVSPLFLQFTRAQLRELVLLADDEPVFFWVNRPAEPLAWDHGSLRGVSEHLADPDLPTPPPPPAETPRRIPRPKPGAADDRTSAVIDGSEHYLAITLPSPEHPTHDEVRDLLKSHGFVLETSNRKWWLRDRHKTLNFLAAHWAALREHFGAQFTPNFEHNTARLQLAQVTCAAAEQGDGYDVTLVLQAGRASDEAVRAALTGGRDYVEDGANPVLLPTATIARLAEVQRRLAGDAVAEASPRRTIRLTGAAVTEAEALLESMAPGFQPPGNWRARSAALRNLSKLEPAPLPPALAAVLRPYQQIGVAWLWHLYRHELAGLLADEMGLGKTLQALALLAALHDADTQNPNSKRQPGKPSLVVCPASLVENWRREAARFTPELQVVVHHGEGRADSATALAGSDLVITSYGTLVRDQAMLAAVEFLCVIGDEAQHIKNRRTQNASALRALRSRGRVLLTGTPVENSLDDLRSLFDFLLPGYVRAAPAGTRGDDRAWIDERLRAQTAPYILRRTKAAVVPELPGKIDQTVFCELAPPQAVLYRQWQARGEHELDALAAAGASEARLRLAALTQLLRLRQICCDPRLVEASAPGAEEASAKLEAFRELLAEATDGGHRLLVFSQFTSLLALLRAELEIQDVPFCYLDGTMRAHVRQAEVDRFQQSPAVPVFLISLKAGGTGLNLTGADMVVHFDPWWNPAVELQATDRAHRIGQTRVVTSYKLICARTVEERVLQLQAAKRALLADVFEASDAAAERLSLADLRGLMRQTDEAGI